MIKLGKIRKELEPFDYCEIIYDLSPNGYRRFDQDYEFVYELLALPDDYELPYNCWEIVYDWDDFGYGDGSDAICFYTDTTGYLASDEKAMRAFGVPYEL